MRLANWVAIGLLYPAWRTAETRFSPPVGALVEHLRNRRRPVIFYTWHACEPVVGLALCSGILDVEITAIGHDGPRSRALQRAFAFYGWNVWVYRRASSVRPKEQIIQHLNGGSRLVGLAADAGGPYRQVRESLVEIAAETNAWLIPVAAGGRRVLEVPWPQRYLVPLPFSKLLVCYGEPLDGPATSLEECQQALEAQERRVLEA